ncbi:hypothetical protein V6C27_12120 [Peptococcaceae bacterium 1198_IL3148]
MSVETTVAHVQCATLPPPAYFTSGSLLNYMSFAIAAGGGFLNILLFKNRQKPPVFVGEQRCLAIT